MDEPLAKNATELIVPSESVAFAVTATAGGEVSDVPLAGVVMLTVGEALGAGAGVFGTVGAELDVPAGGSNHTPLTTAFAAPLLVMRTVTWPETFQTRY